MTCLYGLFFYARSLCSLATVSQSLDLRGCSPSIFCLELNKNKFNGLGATVCLMALIQPGGMLVVAVKKFSVISFSNFCRPQRQPFLASGYDQTRVILLSIVNWNVH